MKKLVLILLMFFGCITFAFAEDRINVQVIFKKFLWTCPVCGQEDVEDRNMSGGQSYIHTCSKCGAKFNQSGNNMKEYNGSINYSQSEYALKEQKDIDTEKTSKFDAWVYEIKHPPVEVEPPLSDYLNLYKDKTDEANQYLQKIIEKGSKTDLEKIKAEYETKIADLNNEIEAKTIK